MKQVTIEMTEQCSTAQAVDSVISLQPLYRYLKEKVENEQTVKADLYNALIKSIEANPELKKPLKPKQLSQHTEMFELIYAYLTGITTEETELLWGLGPPKPGPIFYGTDQLYSLFFDEQQQLDKVAKEQQIRKQEQQQMSFMYSLVMERCYDFNPLLQNDMMHSVIDKTTSLSKYYRINIDTRFIDVKPEGKLPKLDFKKVEEHLHTGKLIDYLREVLPLDKFVLTGFTIIYFTEYTSQYAIQIIKNIILNSSNKPKSARMEDLMQALRTISGCKSIDFGFIPFVRLNGNLLLDFGSLSNSLLLDRHKKDGESDTTVQALLERFIKKPVPLFNHQSGDAKKESKVLESSLKGTDYKSFALLPLFDNGELIGALEVFSRLEHVLEKKLLIKLDAALPYVAQMMKTSVDEFHSNISKVVNDKFTSIQPAVSWRFNTAAWRYMQDCFIGKKEAELENIVFEQLYPLYGAIDIRNSSVERNKGLTDDMHYQLSLLEKTFIQLKALYPLAILDKMTAECEKWLNRLNAAFTTDDTNQLNYFLDQEALPALQHLKQLQPNAASLVEKYMLSLDEETGKAHEHRRNLEISTQMITKSLGNYLDEQEAKMQESYPFYFEKYRTDGVEYDIFIGQALSPNKPYDAIYLKNMRLWQLKSMAHIGNMMHDLEQQMPKVLRVTLLIYVNSDPIDIHFRNDEKRFDVDGGYNIRYQMIKKRIDKVNIQGTKERLTQPGKIALVYSNRQDAYAYISHIRYLQRQNILQDDLEELELEALQGVSGLKALRVGVQITGKKLEKSKEAKPRLESAKA